MLEEAVPSSAGCPVFYLPLALTVTSLVQGVGSPDWIIYGFITPVVLTQSAIARSWYSEGCNRVTTLNLVL